MSMVVWRQWRHPPSLDLSLEKLVQTSHLQYIVIKRSIKHYRNIHCDPRFPPAYYWSANLENKLCIQTVESYLNLISSNNNITFKKIFWLYWRFLPLQSVPARVWRRHVLGLRWWNAAGAPCLGSHCVTSLDPSGSI